MTYNIGDKFICKGSACPDQIYVLCRVSYEENIINLICIEDGNMWHKQLNVRDYRSISDEDFALLTNNKTHMFVKIKTKFRRTDV